MREQVVLYGKSFRRGKVNSDYANSCEEETKKKIDEH